MIWDIHQFVLPLVSLDKQSVLKYYFHINIQYDNIHYLGAKQAQTTADHAL